MQAVLRLPCAKNWLIKLVRLERMTAEHLDGGKRWARLLVAESVRPALIQKINQLKSQNSEKAKCDYQLSIISY